MEAVVVSAVVNVAVAAGVWKSLGVDARRQEVADFIFHNQT